MQLLLTAVPGGKIIALFESKTFLSIQKHHPYAES